MPPTRGRGWDGAPTFEEVGKRLHHALEGAVLVAHNAVFDLGFLRCEFQNVDAPFDPPYLCTRCLPVSLGMMSEGPSLEDLCKQLCIPLHGAHVARNDAQATTMAMLMLRNTALQLGCRTFRDLASSSRGGWYAFFDSFDRDPLQPEGRRALRTCVKPLEPRVVEAESDAGGSLEGERDDYCAALLEAVADYQLSRRQFERLRRIQISSGLSSAQVRSVHAQVLSWALSESTRDDCLDERERHRLGLLYECLSNLGWAPGQ